MENKQQEKPAKEIRNEFFRQKRNFNLNNGILATFFTAFCPIFGVLIIWIFKKESKLYYLFFITGLYLFYCWASYVNNHFEIVYKP